MNCKLHLHQLLALILLLSAILTIPASPIHAKENAGAPLLSPVPGCTTTVGSTIKNGDTIKGSGRLVCKSLGRFWKAYLKVTLQRHRWAGLWQSLDKHDINWSPTPINVPISVQWNCNGNGRHTYRTLVDASVWNVLSGATFTTHLTSNYLRVSC